MVKSKTMLCVTFVYCQKQLCVYNAQEQKISFNCPFAVPASQKPCYQMLPETMKLSAIAFVRSSI